MRKLFIWVLAAVIMTGVSAVAQKRDADVDQLMAQYQAAWNKGDAKGLAALYSQNSLRIGSDGEPLSGKAAIEQSFVKNFGGPWKGTKLTLKPGRTENVTADVRLQEGTYELTGGAAGPQRGRYLNTLVRQDGQWRIAAVAAIPQTAPSK